MRKWLRKQVLLVWPKRSREKTLAVRIVDVEAAPGISGRPETWFIAEHTDGRT